MGQTAENVAEWANVTREDMDEFAAMSQQRAVESQENGFFEREITPVTLADGTVISKDDGPRAGTTVEKLAQLKPVFRPDGRITAGNACPLNDGAAAVLVMSEERASALGLQPLARVVASGVSALNPEIMGLGPVDACRQALGRAKLSIDDIDLVEINEAFAAQVIPSARELDIPFEKLNVHGGADRARPPVRSDRRPHHDHVAQRARRLRWPLRAREHVRRWRPGHGHGRRAPLSRRDIGRETRPLLERRVDAVERLRGRNLERGRRREVDRRVQDRLVVGDLHDLGVGIPAHRVGAHQHDVGDVDVGATRAERPEDLLGVGARLILGADATRRMVVVGGGTSVVVGRVVVVDVVVLVVVDEGGVRVVVVVVVGGTHVAGPLGSGGAPLLIAHVTTIGWPAVYCTTKRWLSGTPRLLGPEGSGSRAASPG